MYNLLVNLEQVYVNLSDFLLYDYFTIDKWRSFNVFNQS